MRTAPGRLPSTEGQQPQRPARAESRRTATPGYSTRPEPPGRCRAGRTVMSTRSRTLATVVLIFASFMDLIDGTIVNVALPSMRDDLNASPAQLEWVVSAYLLAFAVLLVTGGRLGDIFGRRRIFVLGVGGFTLFSLLAAVAPSPEILIAAR